MKTILFIVLMTFTTICISEEGAWEYGDKDSYPRYNPMQDRFEIASPDEELRYNPFEDSFEYESPDSELKYNPFKDRFEYEPEGE